MSLIKEVVSWLIVALAVGLIAAVLVVVHVQTGGL